MTETWPEIVRRHEREKFDLINDLAQEGFTQTETADRLDMTRGAVKGFAARRGIVWPDKRKGCAPSRTVAQISNGISKPWPTIDGKPKTAMQKMAAEENAAMNRRT